MKKLRKTSKREMRALVVKMYNGLGALLAILGFIYLGAIETTIKEFDGSLVSVIKPCIISLVLLAIGAYMIIDGHKHEC